MAPAALHWTTFKEDRRADARAIVDGIPADIEDRSGCHSVHCTKKANPNKEFLNFLPVLGMSQDRSCDLFLTQFISLGYIYI
jgi:hypothetical protein